MWRVIPIPQKGQGLGECIWVLKPLYDHIIQHLFVLPIQYSSVAFSRTLVLSPSLRKACLHSHFSPLWNVKGWPIWLSYFPKEEVYEVLQQKEGLLMLTVRIQPLKPGRKHMLYYPLQKRRESMNQHTLQKIIYLQMISYLYTGASYLHQLLVLPEV